MNSPRWEAPEPPGFDRGVETLRTLEDKMDEAVRRVMPGASPEVLGKASHLIYRSAMVAEARRKVERYPQEPFWVLSLRRWLEMKEDVKRWLLERGVTDEILERLGDLYPVGNDLRRELQASSQIEDSHGCVKCRHCYSSWERSGGVPEGEEPPGPFCDVYGDVPAICFDHNPTRHCRSCGKKVSPARVAQVHSIPVECSGCGGRNS